MPEKNIMVLIDGEGWKKGAIEWLKSAVKEKKYTTDLNRDKEILVYSLTEFFTWANRSFNI